MSKKPRSGLCIPSDFLEITKKLFRLTGFQLDELSLNLANPFLALTGPIIKSKKDSYRVS